MPKAGSSFLGRRLRVGILALTVSVLAPAAPAAAEKGVHVDPDSPAGKEYAIPFESAREDAAGGKGDRGGSQGNAPMFGVGISPGGGGTDSSAGGGSQGAAGGGSQGAAGGGTNRDSGGDVVGTARGSTASLRSLQDVSTGESTSALLSVLAIALGVLLAGGLLGLLVRRRTAAKP
jgi:hypothetical protein